MFTYIMPTILKTDKWVTQLRSVLLHPLIHEVKIIIDLPETDLKLVGFPNAEKCKIYYTGGGFFCNGAWNYALEQSIETENIIISNDDILYNVNIFDEVNKLDLKNIGIVGCFNTYGRGKDGEVRISPVRGSGFGQLMFLNKEHYTKIPEGIKHWFGDDWLFYKMYLKGKSNYTIDLKILTNVGESSGSEEVKERIRIDFQQWDTLKNEFKQWLA